MSTSNPGTGRKSTDPDSPERITLRRAKPDDLPAIVTLEQKSFPTTWSQDSLCQEIDREIALFFIASQAERLVGYSLSWIAADELHILKLAVEPAMRRNKIATLLMRKTMQAAREGGGRMAYLEVRENNQAALRFYESLGFRILGVRRKYYTDTGEDAILWVANLTEPDGKPEAK